MTTFEPSPDLDPAVAQAIQDAMSALRAEFLGGGAKNETDRIEQLDEAVRALDRAEGQTELLAALLEEAGRFAERSLFLVRDDHRFTGWAAFGFGSSDDEVAAVEVSGGAWSRLTDDREPVDLSAADCGEVCAALGARHAEGGLAVPFELRGSTAGALYADGSTIDRAALRLLVYIAAQALETLPVRRGAAPAAPAERVAAPPPVEPPTPAAPAADETPEPEPTPEPTPEKRVRDEEVEDAIASATERVVPEETTKAPERDDLVSIHQDVTPEGFDTVVEDFTTSEEVDLDQVVTAEIDDLEAIDEPEVDPGFATQEISTLEEPPPEPEPKAPSRSIEQSEFAPPAELDGPGWAFGDRKNEDDAGHEEARRLARLLVTEIKLYNEEKVREARESGSLYEALKEDIDRSRRIYSERIEETVRDSSDYFQDELVRILAGGDASALGA